VLLVER